MLREIKSCEDTDITIAVDSRERPLEIENKLITNYDIKVLRRWLPAGDYLINDTVAVERKISIDFAKSIIDGRLFRQAVKMKLFFPRALLIIEGKSLESADSNIHPHCIRGGLINLIVCWQIPVLFSQDLEETALFLWLIGRSRVVKKKPFFFANKKPLKAFSQQQARVLGELPGIGPNLAIRLLKHFGAVERTMVASEEELRQIRGIGLTKARKIRELVTNCDNFNCQSKNL